MSLRAAAGVTPRTTVGTVLLVLTALIGCGSEPPGREAGAGAGTSSAAEDGGLPVSASLSTDSAPAATPPAGAASDSVIPSDADEARQVIEEYYAAIAAGDYERAFARWGESGRASGQSYLEFVAGFAETAGVTVSVGEAGRVEGAAGSRYIEFPVVVEASTKEGARQRFQGTYTLRRAVVDGASPEQRRWHLYDAELREVR